MQKSQSMSDRRKSKRKNFTYYMQVVDEDAQQTIGHLVDISTLGFKVDCQMNIPPGKDFRLRFDLTSDVADVPYMIFKARSKWCRVDELYPYMFNVGFEIMSISPHDAAIYARIVEKYGEQEKKW